MIPVLSRDDVPQDGRAESPLQGVRVLDAWINRDWTAGIDLSAIPPLQRLRVWTRNSVYDVITGDAAGEVRVRGGRAFAVWTTAHLAGAVAGGSVLKYLAIHVGLGLEFHVEARSVRTTRVEAVAVLSDPPTV
jgi:hypothetical protein